MKSWVGHCFLMNSIMLNHNWLGPIVRIAPDEVSVADPHSVQLIYGIKSGFTKVAILFVGEMCISIVRD